MLFRIGRFALVCAVMLRVSAGTLAAQRCASIQAQVTGMASVAPVLRVRLTDSTGVVVSMAPVSADGRAVLPVASARSEAMAEVFGEGVSRRRRISLMRTTNPDCSVTIPLDAFTGTLEGVRVVARREALAERFVGSLAVGASEQLSDGSAAALLPTDGDVAARARTQLLTLVQDGAVSLGGLATRESQQRLNGMVNGAGVLPRSLPVRQRVGTGAYDITAGGFSGASVELEIARAGEFRDLRADVITGVAPTPRGEATPTASTVAVDAGGEWRSVDQRHGASVGIRTALTQSPFTSVQTASPALRGAAGFGQQNVDTVLALLAREDPQLLAQPGRRAPVQWTTAVAARFDPFIAPSASSAASHQNALIVAAEHSVAAAELQDISATASLATGAERTTGSAMWQHQRTRAATRFDGRLGIRGARESIMSPGSAFATLDVPVTAPDADAGTTVGQTLRFGGVPGRTSTERGIEARGVATRQLRSTRITGLVALRVDIASLERQTPDVRARFASSDALAASAVSSVVVRDGASETAASAGRGAAGVGFEQRVGSRVRVQGGVRLDVQRLASTGTDGGPSPFALPQRTIVTADLSPRVGITWLVLEPRDGVGIRTTPLFSRHLIPSGQLRAGFGRFVSDVEPSDVTGLAPPFGITETRSCAGRQLTASGDDPRFRARALSRACDGRGDGDAMQVTRVGLAPTYRSPYAWRGTASWVGQVAGVQYTVDALRDEGFRKPSVSDANLTATPAMEGTDGRPVYAPGIDRDRSSGDWLATAGRRDPRLGSDLVVDAAGRTTISQIAFSVSPRTGDSQLALRLGYVWLRSRSLENGWVRDTRGDPRLAEWGPAATAPRHQVQLEMGRELWPGVSLSTWIRVRSGLPFTPLVDRDINADGVARNDRAFIPDWTAPGASADVTRWAALLPVRALHCLERQRGRIAARGSCTGPWSAQSNLTVTLDGRRIGLTERTQLTASLENLGGGLEQLLALAPGRAVGGAASVDAVLARVRPDGAVDLNPRIGRTLPPVPGLGGGWRVVLSANRALSAPVQRQQLTRWLDLNGVGRRLAADSLARRLSRNVVNLYDTLEEADAELAYDDLQRQIIASRRRLYDRTRDSIWTDVATRLNRLPSRVSVDSAIPLLQAATDTAWHLSWVHARAFAASLTPIQRQLLPWPASALAMATRRPRFNIVYY